jgi:hypothetical protein
MRSPVIYELKGRGGIAPAMVEQCSQADLTQLVVHNPGPAEEAYEPRPASGKRRYDDREEDGHDAKRQAMSPQKTGTLSETVFRLLIQAKKVSGRSSSPCAK